MNTLTQRYGIYTKDIKLLLKMTVLVFIVQLAVLLLLPLLLFVLEQMEVMPYSLLVEDWFPKVQVSMSMIMALIAAGHWWAEERGGGNTDLLNRLPISRTQLWTEKTLAGITCVIAVILVQNIWFILLRLIGPFFGVSIDSPLDEFFYITFNTSVYAYFIGLPFSYYLKHTIGVIVLGLTMFIPGMWFMSIVFNSNAEMMRGDMAYGIAVMIEYTIRLLPFILVIAIPFVVYCYLKIRYKRHSILSNKQFLVLIQKHIREMAVYIVVAFMILIATLISAVTSNNTDFALGFIGLLMVVAVIASLLTGITSYTSEEKGGLNCVLYHHPIPLSHIFWSKMIPGLGIASVLSISFVFAAMTLLSNDTSTFSEVLMGSPSRQEIHFSGLPFIEVVLPFFVMLFFAGLLPFAVGVLMSHIIPNTIYAFLEAVPFGIGLFIAAIYLQYADKANTLQVLNFMGGEESFYIPPVPWIFMIPIAFLLLATWRATTDRRLLTSSILQRQLYISRLYLLVIALTVLVFKVGVWDSLYLMTGIDLGIG